MEPLPARGQPPPLLQHDLAAVEGKPAAGCRALLFLGAARCGCWAPSPRRSVAGSSSSGPGGSRTTPRCACAPTPAALLLPALQGSQLEPRLGSAAYGALVAELALVSNALYMGLAALLARHAPALGWSLMHACAVGFSGVLFGMKVGTRGGGGGSSGSLCGLALRAGCARAAPEAASLAAPGAAGLPAAAACSAIRPGGASCCRTHPVHMHKHSSATHMHTNTPAPFCSSGGAQPQLARLVRDLWDRTAHQGKCKHGCVGLVGWSSVCVGLVQAKEVRACMEGKKTRRAPALPVAALAAAALHDCPPAPPRLLHLARVPLSNLPGSSL